MSKPRISMNVIVDISKMPQPLKKEWRETIEAIGKMPNVTVMSQSPLEQARQLLLDYVENVSVKVFPIPCEEDETDFEYLTRTNQMLEKFFMLTWDLVKNLHGILEKDC